MEHTSEKEEITILFILPKCYLLNDIFEYKRISFGISRELLQIENFIEKKLHVKLMKKQMKYILISKRKYSF